MKLRIYFENSQEKERVTYALKMLVRESILAALAYEKVKDNCEVSVTFTDNEGIRELNRKFRGLDRPTDVLSFPLFDGEFPEENGDSTGKKHKLPIGDIVISMERALVQSIEYDHSFERELAFLCVHSVLHLLGYDHERSETEERDMFRRQDEILNTCGFKRFPTDSN